MNDENLTPFEVGDERTRKAAAAGGKATGRKRRRNKEMLSIVRDLMRTTAGPAEAKEILEYINEENPTYSAALAVQLLKSALAGSTNAARQLTELLLKAEEMERQQAERKAEKESGETLVIYLPWNHDGPFDGYKMVNGEPVSIFNGKTPTKAQEAQLTTIYQGYRNDKTALLIALADVFGVGHLLEWSLCQSDSEQIMNLSEMLKEPALLDAERDFATDFTEEPVDTDRIKQSCCREYSVNNSEKAPNGTESAKNDRNTD